MQLNMFAIASLQMLGKKKTVSRWQNWSFFMYVCDWNALFFLCKPCTVFFFHPFRIKVWGEILYHVTFRQAACYPMTCVLHNGIIYASVPFSA